MQVYDVVSVWPLQVVQGEACEHHSDRRAHCMWCAFTIFPQCFLIPCGLAVEREGFCFWVGGIGGWGLAGSVAFVLS